MNPQSAEVVDENLSDYLLEIGTSKSWKQETTNFNLKGHMPSRTAKRGYPSVNLCMQEVFSIVVS